MFIVGTTRSEIIKYLPKQKIVLEIGVASGIFSEIIYKNSEPSILHLIDPWKFNSEGVMGNPDNVTDEEGEKRFKEVNIKFKNEIKNGKVILHRDFSYNILQKFPDRYFDWVYLDAEHLYDDVSRDLNLLHNKIKDDGFILGHDYTNNEIAKNLHFGVVEAVNNFVKEKNYHFLVATYHQNEFPTFVLSKTYEHSSDQFLGNVVRNFDFLVEIENFDKVRYEQKIFSDQISNKTITRIIA